MEHPRGKANSPGFLLQVKKSQRSQRMISDIFQEDFWTQVTAAELTRLSQLILDKVTLFEDHMEMDIKSGGMKALWRNLQKMTPEILPNGNIRILFR